MKTSTPFPTRKTLLFILLTGAVVLAGCDKNTTDETSSVTDANVTQKVEQARTPADHQDLAAYYDARAQQAERDGTEERELKGQYERRWQPGDHPMGPGAGRHFESLAEEHQATASHYRAMGQWHREMAERTEKSSAAAE